MENSRFLRGIFFFLIFMSIVLAGFLLKLMESFFKPVVLSVLLACVFYPFIRKLNTKFKIPWFLGILIVYTTFLVIFSGLVNILSSSLMSIVESYPKYEERFRTIYRTMQESFAANSDSSLLNFFFDFNQDQTLLENISNQLNILSLLKNFAVNFTNSLVSFMKSTFLVLLFSIFLLLEMKFIKIKISTAFSSENSTKIHDIMSRIAIDTTHYVSIKFLISLATGILMILSCLVAGIDFPLVWGFIAFLLNFVPTFGSIISTGLTVVFAFMQCYPSVLPVIFLAIFLAVMNIFLGNVVEPRIEGENLGISPFVILVSLSLWGWLWGFLGLIIAVPLMVIIKIFCENISYLRPIGILLGSGKTARQD
ncbi:AI-2E family transporter [uncultured Treponema sp.]|uniref:AI-2E family transporter n=1 Tax=uncultured Treponema sp. TaxID=162155 RepID=UPI0025F19DA5|nr:AI-2E family transporter [uncultured Treponema sp.]